MAFRVLIVDDSAAMRSFIRRVIELSGFEAGVYLEAASGEEALRALENEWVDVILTDLNMPGMGGEGFVKQVKQDELLRTVPVLVVSTDGTEKRKVQMLSLGARGYVKKPFQPETLREELERALEVPHD
jgi:two-component system chemotaxis response regulator CheY